METGAVIVAAGRSSRMGEFKPMMTLGHTTVARHVIQTFRAAGVTEITVVTGRNAEQLREHLAQDHVTFLHNENYLTTEMFDSAKIGLSHLAERCSQVLFTPVDIPLFTPRTVRALLETHAPLACPVCSGKQGHPLLLSASVIRSVLTDSGEGGLKGAISRLGIPMTRVEVDDPGVLRDADTQEEFQALLELYRQNLYPSGEQIEQLMAQVPQQIRAHGEAVAAKAAALATQAGQPVDQGLLRAACLLHDMAKPQGKAHPALAAEVLRQEGWPVPAEIVAQHHDLSDQPSAEAELLYLADKLVRGVEDVSLEARFSASKQKCLSPDALAHWERRYHAALQIVERYHLDV